MNRRMLEGNLIVAKDGKERFVYAPVLITDEPDADQDKVGAEKIEKLCHEFAEKYGQVDVMHTLNNVGKVLENHIQRQDWTVTNIFGDTYTIPKGSWLMGVKVADDETWEKVEKGELRGFSIMGLPKTTLKEMRQAHKSKKDIVAASKRTTIADLEKEGDWVVTAISLVDNPAVPKDLFLIVKGKDEPAKKEADGFIPGSFEHISWLLLKEIGKMVELGVATSFPTTICIGGSKR
jgi:hypothetical protein